MYLDVIDIVKEKSGDYKKEEDPKIYKSKVTGRGPLTDEWLANYKSETSNNHEKFMCAYKRCKVSSHCRVLLVYLLFVYATTYGRGS